MLKKILRISFVFLPSLLLSCATPPDIFVCTKLEVNKGFCVKTISDEEMTVDDTHKINGKTWLDLEMEAVYLPIDSWVSIKQYIVKNCKKNNDCNANIDSWNRKINAIDSNLK